MNTLFKCMSTTTQPEWSEACMDETDRVFGTGQFFNDVNTYFDGDGMYYMGNEL